MIDRYLVIFFNNYKETSKGGYGDKIVGLMSCFMLAKILNLKFRICWERNKIETLLGFSSYMIGSERFDEDNTQYFDHIDFEMYFKNNKNDLFPKKFNVLTLGSEISHLIIEKKNKESFYKDILDAYQSLYDEILIPCFFISNKIKELTKDKNNPIVGVQVRMGDSYIKGIKGYPALFSHRKRDINNTKQGIKDLLESIKKHIPYSEYDMFITSDYYEVLPIARGLFDNIIYNDMPITHSGQSKNSDFNKVLIDNIFLSTKCDLLYISEWSNFGRISALVNKSTIVYSIRCEALNKIDLISKKKIVFHE